MAISHRLQSTMYKRPDEGVNEKPKRIVFLSMEGDRTEKDYFDLINKFRESLGIKSIVHIETLSRRDTRSDPKSVLALLDDSFKIQEEGITSKEVYTSLTKLGYSVTLENVDQYFNEELSCDKKLAFEMILQSAQIDVNYQKYLSEYKGEDVDDIFAVVIDRDSHCHPEEGMKQLIQSCQQKGYKCYITNPCFEFWLLLHVCDVKEKYHDHLEDIRKNNAVSNKHTYVSKELSTIAGHYKSINEATFKENYLPNVDSAISRSQCFETNLNMLLYNIGTNIPELFSILRT